MVLSSHQQRCGVKTGRGLHIPGFDFLVFLTGASTCFKGFFGVVLKGFRVSCHFCVFFWMFCFMLKAFLTGPFGDYFSRVLNQIQVYGCCSFKAWFLHIHGFLKAGSSGGVLKFKAS